MSQVPTIQISYSFSFYKKNNKSFNIIFHFLNTLSMYHLRISAMTANIFKTFFCDIFIIDCFFIKIWAHIYIRVKSITIVYIA